MRYFVSILAWLLFLPLHGQQKEKDNILLLDATIHVGNGTIIESGFIHILKGRIVETGSSKQRAFLPSDYDTVLKLSGKHVWPGIIALNTTIGLREIDAVRSTLDFNETGELNQNVRSLIAYNTDSKIIPTIRSNGILAVQAVPRGSLIGGTSSVFHTSGWNWEDAVLKTDDGLHLFWPESGTQGKPSDTPRLSESSKIKIQKLEELFTQAAYSKQTHIKLQPIKKVLSGEFVLYVHANKARDITDVIMFAQKHKVSRLVLVGAAESWRVAGMLKKYQVPVVLSSLHRLPSYPDEAADLPFRIPAILKDSGITVALSYNGEMEANIRNLGFIAGTAAAYGVNKEDALQMITLNPAKICGIANDQGSLEPGKAASFLVSAGDILDMRTSRIELMYIEGKKQNLDDLHKQLYRKFRNKYQQN